MQLISAAGDFVNGSDLITQRQYNYQAQLCFLYIPDNALPAAKKPTRPLNPLKTAHKTADFRLSIMIEDSNHLIAIMLWISCGP